MMLAYFWPPSSPTCQKIDEGVPWAGITERVR